LEPLGAGYLGAVRADIPPWFDAVDYYSYPVRNRYMSYSRHNGATIDREYVLVFSRRSD
jgi:hypothetical protein